MKRNNMSLGLQMCLEQALQSPIAAYNAAILLESEHKGPAAAQYFYLRSAFGGYVPAMLKVAGLFITGQYIEDSASSYGVCLQDLEQGAFWIRRAAKTGDSTANYLMARCYLDGIGVKASPSCAMYYLQQVVFPKYPINPYEPDEALVFGNVSKNLGSYLSHLHRKKFFPPAG